MNKAERVELEKEESLVKKHALYPGFVQHMKKVSTKTLAPRSITNRLNVIETLRNNHSFDLMGPDIEGTMTRLREHDISAASMNLYKWVIRLWCDYRRIPISQDDSAWLTRKTGPRKRQISARDLLTADERALILGEIKSPAMWAYLAALWDTGARPSELSRMTLHDVQEDQHGFIQNVHQTKYKVMLRPVRMLDPHSIAVFADWFRVHPNAGSDSEAPLFLTSKRDMLDPHTIAGELRERFNARFNRGTGTRASLNCYLYRKSRITHLLKEGSLTPIQIKVRIGHSKHSHVLEEYYAILDEMDQADAELKYIGVIDKEKQIERATPCPHCGAPNLESATRCFRCRQALTESGLVRDQERLLQDAVRTILRDEETLQVVVDALSERLAAQEEADPPPEE